MSSYSRALTLLELAHRRRVRWALAVIVCLALAVGVGLVLPT